MKSICTLITLILLFQQARSQSILSNANLHCNRINCWTDAGSGLISNNDGYSGYTVTPENDSTSALSTLYFTSINVTGLVDDTIKGSIRYYDDKGNTIAGPIETGNTQEIKYNRLWKVNKWEIIDLINDFNDNQVIDNTPGLNILTWPGKNNPYSEGVQGILWSGRDFAPYFDRDQDGIYDPYKGDYPILDINCPTKIPGEMIWSIYHPKQSDNSFGPTIKIEIHKLIYGYQSDQEALINTSIFANIKVHSFEDNLTDARLTLFNDVDLGCPDNDILGTSELHNSIFSYNDNPLSGFCFEEDASYVQTITCLNKKLSGTMMSVAQPGTGIPQSIETYYNWSHNRWNDGTHLTYGGTGYDPDSTDYTNYIFPSSPSDTNGWSMKTADIKGFEYRIFNTVELGDLENGDVASIDFAFTFHPADSTITIEGQVDSCLANIPVVQSFFNNCFDTELHDPTCLSDCLWPGDTDRNGIVNNLDFLNIGIAMNDEGPKRKIIFDEWIPQIPFAWNQETEDGINYSYIDCNGSGQINSNDIKTIDKNFYQTNPSYEDWGGYNLVGPDLTFKSEKDVFPAGQSLFIDLILGGTDSISLTGLGFTIEYDPTLIKPLSNNSINIKIGEVGESITFRKIENGKIHGAVVSTSGQDKTYQGASFGRIRFSIINNLPDTTISFKYSNYEKIDANGKVTPLTATQKTITVSNTLTSATLKDSKIRIYPNPASDYLQIQTLQAITGLQIISSSGFSFALNPEGGLIDVRKIPAGFYILRALTDHGDIFINKLIIHH